MTLSSLLRTGTVLLAALLAAPLSLDAAPEGDGPSLEVSPSSGVFLTSQTFDLVLLVDAGDAAVFQLEVLLDDRDVTDRVLQNTILGAVDSGASSFRLSGLRFPQPGPTELVVTLELDDGTSLVKELEYEVHGVLELP